MLRTIHNINIDKEVNNKDPKFKVGDHAKGLLKDLLQIDLKRFL